MRPQFPLTASTLLLAGACLLPLVGRREARGRQQGGRQEAAMGQGGGRLVASCTLFGAKYAARE